MELLTPQNLPLDNKPAPHQPAVATAQDFAPSKPLIEASTPPSGLSQGGTLYDLSLQGGTPHNPVCWPNSFTGRFNDVLSVLRKKWEVKGIYAHHVDNGKASRSDDLISLIPLFHIELCS